MLKNGWNKGGKRILINALILFHLYVMAMWGLIVATGLAIGSLPLLVGLAVVLPILGHSTWHLYRMVVVPDARARPQFRAAIKGRRYAAEFPVSLFTRHKADE